MLIYCQPYIEISTFAIHYYIVSFIYGNASTFHFIHRLSFTMKIQKATSFIKCKNISAYDRVLSSVKEKKKTVVIKNSVHEEEKQRSISLLPG